MEILIPQLIIVLALVGIIVILARKIPVVAKMEIKEEEILENQNKIAETESLVDRTKRLSHKYLDIILGALERLLKQLRISSLKLENKSALWIQELRKKSRKVKKLKDRANLNKKEKELIAIIAKNPQDIEAYKNLGFLYLEQKNYRDARSSFEEALRINPEDKEAGKQLKELKTK